MTNLFRFVAPGYTPYRKSESYFPDHSKGYQLADIELIDDDQNWYSLSSFHQNNYLVSGFWVKDLNDQNGCYQQLRSIIFNYAKIFKTHWGGIQIFERDNDLMDDHFIEWMKLYRPDLFSTKQDFIYSLNEIDHLRYCCFKLYELYSGIEQIQLINDQSMIDFMKENKTI